MIAANVTACGGKVFRNFSKSNEKNLFFLGRRQGNIEFLEDSKKASLLNKLF
jgi:hypothetical protein